MTDSAVEPPKSSWREMLVPADGNPALFDERFLRRHGDQPWEPGAADRVAAEALQVQFNSRIATQALDYRHGVEATALISLRDLFTHARSITEANRGCRHFETVAWHVLNTHVRPLTAKWHPRVEAGLLNALDTTDEFRWELARLRPLLVEFCQVLADMRDGVPRPRARVRDDGETPARQQIAAEMAKDYRWGIRNRQFGKLDRAEHAFVVASREVRTPDFQPDYATGLALSGGGIRSATFSLGVLVALASRNILPQIDYLSTVSGGGFLGAFLTTFLSRRGKPDRGVGLGKDELPFRRKEGEAAALRHLRHNSRYLLTGSLWGRFQIVAAALQGFLINLLAVTMIVAVLALIDYLTRPKETADWWYPDVVAATGLLFAVSLIVVPLFARVFPRFRGYADRAVGLALLPLIACVAWSGLGGLHVLLDGNLSSPENQSGAGLVLLGLGLLLTVVAAAFLLFRRRGRIVLAIVMLLAVPLFLLAVELFVFEVLEARPALVWLAAALAIGGLVILFVAIDVNYTSLHRHYRGKLAKAFVIRPPTQTGPKARSGNDPFDHSVRLKLSEIRPESGVPYPLFNCALNVPGSGDAAMQGRLTDFFVFSPRFSGSPLIRYRRTRLWQNADDGLDVATAMAISGAAASPQMGLATQPRFRFWLALFNVRLGYWLRKPGLRRRNAIPHIGYLLREMFGRMSENNRYLYLSDGGHIENLGVFELLRRRCKYIIAIDGERDPTMTFHGLTNLQRLAAIDLDTRIDINLDELRLDAAGLSRSHFRLCRIRYPGGDIGYLLYLKLSLTGNEGEFLRRYRADEPAFPHDSTADQSFSEAQFEAYRALGEHVGDKLFLAAIVGERLAGPDDVNIACWFEEMGKSLLEPLDTMPPRSGRS